MSYFKFKQALKYVLNICYSGTADISFNSVNKVNKLEEKINIHFTDKNVCPSISLDMLYDMFQEHNMEYVVKYITNLCHKNPKFNMPEINEEEARKCLTFQLISSENNRALLDEVPFEIIPGTDLVLILRWKVSDEASFIVKRDFIDKLHLPIYELFEIAQNNLDKELAVIKDLREIIADMMKCNIEEIPNEVGLHVLTNQKQIYGATMLAQTNILEEIEKKLNGLPFFILPSSLHEILIVPDTGELIAADLYQMVHQINATQVDVEDQLSNGVYKYKNGKLKRAF